KTAAAIVKHRDENGPFRSRAELKKVKGIGEKCFEQASGFLRIRSAENPLDNTGIHPEQYAFIDSLCSKLQMDLSALISNPAALDRINVREMTGEGRGVETIRDIINELKAPGRDPRQEFSAFEFNRDVNSMEDLQEEMVLPGIVTNVTAFGAFVDIGVHQDGLVHISQLADRFVSDPSDIVKVSQKVMVRVMEVDLGRKRISLSMKGINQD
ncbi:MAG: S1 RNA-binding domain-containing protein, partial [Spirochaetales bacterium]|nr:S1 RNA-binding domain-containing protein [Spirochaetales bacterium]